MTISTLISFPASLRKGEQFEIRATIRHPMETGYRRSAEGNMMPRDLIRRMTCHFESGEQRDLIFAASLFAAIAANPFIAFQMRAVSSGVLVFLWVGDNGFNHVERVPLTVR